MRCTAWPLVHSICLSHVTPVSRHQYSRAMTVDLLPRIVVYLALYVSLGPSSFDLVCLNNDEGNIQDICPHPQAGVTMLGALKSFKSTECHLGLIVWPVWKIGINNQRIPSVWGLIVSMDGMQCSNSNFPSWFIEIATAEAAVECYKSPVAVVLTSLPALCVIALS